MAKPSNPTNATIDNTSANGKVFQLTAGEYKPVASRVGSMKFEKADGSEFTVPKTAFTKVNAQGKTVDRFIRRRHVPFVRSTNQERSAVLTAVNDWLDALAAFDAADAWRLPNGQEKARSFKILADSKGNAISAERYLLELLDDAHSLAMQKIMQTKLRDEAEEILRAEFDIPAPAKKARGRKSFDGGSEVEDSDE